MPDKSHRFLLENLDIRGEWVSLKQSWKKIQQTTDYPEPVRQVLGEALAAICLLAGSLKFDGSLTLQIRGTEPVTMLVVQATSKGKVRAIAHWKGDIADSLSFKDLFGDGSIVISVENKPKRGAQQGERYQSLVSLEGDSLADCLQSYFEQSEQLKTRLWLAASKDAVAGLMLQSLPSNETNDISENDWNHAVILADTLTNNELLGLEAVDLLHRLYHEEDLRLYEAKAIDFECSCSQEKIENMIFSLGEIEANDMLAEQGCISVDCEFCNQHYELDRVDVARLFSDTTVLQPHGKGRVH